MSKRQPDMETFVTQAVVTGNERIIESTAKTNSVFIGQFSSTILETLKDTAVEAYVRLQQQKFHENLTFAQKYIPLIEKDKTRFNFKTRFKAQTLNLAMSAGLVALDTALNSGWLRSQWNRRINVPKMYKALINNLLYINNHWSNETEGVPTRTYLRLQGLISRWQLHDPDHLLLRRTIDEFYEGFTHQLEPLPLLYQRDTNALALYLTHLLRLSDAEDLVHEEGAVQTRARSMCKDMYGLSDDEYNIVRSNAVNESMLLSSLVSLTSFSIQEFFSDLKREITDTSERVNILVEHDPFALKRQAQKERILKASVFIAAGGLTFLTGPVGDFLVATTAPMLLSTMNPNSNPVLQKKLLDRFNDGIDGKRRELGENKENQQ